MQTKRITGHAKSAARDFIANAPGKIAIRANLKNNGTGRVVTSNTKH